MSSNKNDLKRLITLLGIIHTIKQLLAISRNEIKLYQMICSYLVRLKDYKLIWIGLKEEGQDEIIPAAIAGKNSELVDYIKNSWEKYRFDAFSESEILKSGESFLIRELAGEKEMMPWDSKAAEYGFLSVLVLPIKYRKDILGTIHMYSDAVRSLKEEISFLKEVAGYISIAVKSIRAERELKESKKEYEELFRRISSCVAIYKAIADGNDFIIKDFNIAAEKAEKVRKEDVIGRSVLKVFPGVKDFGLFEVFKRVYKTGKAESYPVSFYKDKRITGWRENFVYKLPSGEIVAVYDDLTEKKKAEEELKNSYARIYETLDNTIKTFASVIETKDPFTAGHQIRVTKLAVAIAKELKLDGQIIDFIKKAATIHDVGKMAIPTSILVKPSTLSDIETSFIVTHCEAGYNILKDIDFGYPVADIVYQHHERENGSGYPRGLKSTEIMFEAKIIAVADVVEAMSSHRPYRPAHGINAALKEICDYKGILYDPRVVEACRKVFKIRGFLF